ncbi:MAG TPA: NPCBM/NEW2 domain-containing protein [Planctomycetota bacterium]|nr:NPCBM/NEW2 domain-containing protein [Planctomycetota bacterium]
MRAGLLVVGVVLASAGTAPSQFTLSTVDRAPLAGSPGGLDAQGRLVWRTGEGAEAFPLDRVVGFESSATETPPPAGGVKLELATGDVIYGRLEDGPADEVRLAVEGLGTLAFPLDDVRTLWNREGRSEEGIDLGKPDPNDDRLFVERDGKLDHLAGVLERVTRSEVVFTSAAGDKRPFGFVKDRVVAVRLAGEAPASTAERSALVKLVDGSRLSGALKAGENGGLRLKIAGGPETALEASRLKSVQMTGGAFAFLSDLPTATYVQTPFLAGGRVHEMRRDAGARPGEPLRIGGERFGKGLLLHARSEATWRLDGAYRRFTARVGVDPATRGAALPGAATLTVLVDGRPKWTGPTLRAGQDPVGVDADLSGGKELRIVVEFADSFDAGARVVIGSPMLLK